ncbi:hypothetical protein CALVIDRAFT_563991 [Calocera viscosa TUFC12733]|uniref:Probable RNA polymerase II nuclear localization protein SLC7A6OS n=1 Tax=Calocera viscosa (strain TUFC12733) TaxID=1330018 RepID=A0A167MAS3_CALVF|nr:hypothetical protein CALVIDRAFT_563991 [Calocera viscosa TUFC12733]
MANTIINTQAAAVAAASTPSLMVVGIKRHRDQPPLKALVYGAASGSNPSSSPSSPMMERRKRRRVSEAPETGMFMFAETMDANSWLATQKGEKAAELQKRISDLEKTQSQEPSQPTADALSAAPVEAAPSSAPVQPKRMYRIMPRRKSAALNLEGASTPPEGKVGVPDTIPEAAEKELLFKYLEAELVSVDEAAKELEKAEATKKKEKEKRVEKAAEKPSKVNDKEMDVFNDMVERFLKMHGDLEPDKPLKRPGRPSTDSPKASAPTSATQSGTTTPLTAKEALDKAIAERGTKTPGDDEYVYDLFYFSREKAAEIQMMQLINQGQVASLTGMSAVFDETEEYTSGEEDDSEVDEDSNDENYYQNDYPEERENEEDNWSDSQDDLARRQQIEDGVYYTENRWDDDDEGDELRRPDLSSARAGIFDRFGRRHGGEYSDEEEE